MLLIMNDELKSGLQPRLVFYDHVTYNTVDGTIHARCGQMHDEPTLWEDCPVASNWVLVRAS